MAVNFLAKPIIENVTLLGSVQALSPQEEAKIIKARRILGEIVTGVTDEDLQTFITELQYLINSWFDYYETKTFGGKTLRQVVHGD